VELTLYFILLTYFGVEDAYLVPGMHAEQMETDDEDNTARLYAKEQSNVLFLLSVVLTLIAPAIQIWLYLQQPNPWCRTSR
jgi:hypothetical protein